MLVQRNAVAEYLRARRARLQPEDVGLPRAPGRRVAGLRREEVAALARISPEYYVRLERGYDHQPSDQVLRALAQALLLDESATAYLLRLNNAGTLPTSPSHRPDSQVPEPIHALLANLTETPAFVMDGNHDVLAGNALAVALQSTTLHTGANLVLVAFTPECRERMGELWRAVAERIAASFRLRGNPDDTRYREVLAEVLINDPDFPEIWANHDVKDVSYDMTPHWIDPFGRVPIHWQHLRIPETDLVLVIGANPPGSEAAAALRYLAETLRSQR
ncbi:helix-turn-helix domain-containing protein [Nocardioides sp. CER19]|uniref:MmyB family transcriptional regulator n=1 Tax=Nocardioides sp. CER19 TaxID=3038538 RepID=UPI002448FE3D|nr:helix-turn-helix domain-containing protein [Nocardioides sp. CER19]MDH2413861.1 helix-turn-helix domain-containing protein [Nocardioides sp. CER19]